MTQKPTNRVMDTQIFRVTSIYHNSNRYGYLNGVPIDSNKGSKRDRVKTAFYRISVGVNWDELPVIPTVGQYWEVTGVRDIKRVDVGGYTITEHTYSNSTLECHMPTTPEGFVSFIAAQKAFKGIGEKKARTLWSRFRGGIYDLLKVDNEFNRNQLATELTDESINCLYAGFSQYANLQSANWMTRHEIPFSVQQRLLRYHNQATIDAIKSDPYRLMTFGLSFKVADQLAKTAFSLLPTDHRRLLAAIEDSLRKEVTLGHTAIHRPVLRKRLYELLEDTRLVNAALTMKEDRNRFVHNPESNTYHPIGSLVMESVIARRLVALSQNRNYEEDASECLLTAKSELSYELTSLQTHAVFNALKNGTACITGGAGTGKTTVLRTALRCFTLLGYKIHAMALSGRAAMRMKESVGIETKTIAAFLRGKVVSGGKQLIVIDEASMLDIPLMYKIITHITPDVRVLLVGDPNQLPPIGPGRVLADVVASGVIANVTLDVVKRQEGSSGIPQYSNLINQGELPPKLSAGAITFHEVDNRDEIISTCCKLFEQLPESSKVVAPTNLLVDEVNKRIQLAINKDGKPIRYGVEEWQTQVRQGDQILFTKNDYNHDVRNGSLGVLTNVEKIWVSSESGKKECMGVIEVAGGRSIFVDMDIIEQITLGYAMSLHRAQGSQFPRVIIALDKARNVDRSWLYTAVTRAEVEVHIVGRKDVLERAVMTLSHSSSRNTHLTTLLKKYF